MYIKNNIDNVCILKRIKKERLFILKKERINFK